MFYSTTILSPKNKQTNMINNMVLDIIETPAQKSYSMDTPITDGNHTVVPEELLETLQPSGFPPHILTLKLGAVYMLLRNINVKRGLCNGSRIVLTHIGSRILHYDLLRNDGTVKEQDLILPKIPLIPTEGYPFKFTRSQYPIVPAYAITINKGQGCTFEKIGINLTEHCFTHGQLYVALSRTRNFQNITVLLPENQFQTRNIVWKCILQKNRITAQDNTQPITGDIFPSEYNSQVDLNSDFLNDDFIDFYSTEVPPNFLDDSVFDHSNADVSNHD